LATRFFCDRLRLVANIGGIQMPRPPTSQTRALDEVAEAINDATTTVEDLQHGTAPDEAEALSEVHTTLEEAAERVDELSDHDE
jgi:hypothetical protein